MTKLDKATDLYLRGFNGQYIKRRTDISVQSLLKQKQHSGIRYDKHDIVQYQVTYISENYSRQEIEQGYIDIITNHDTPDKLRRGKHILVLGCGFGDYPNVFKRLLGVERYTELKNQCWKEKQTKTMLDKYGVDNVFRKEVITTFVSEDAVKQGRIKRTKTMNNRYGVDEPLQNHDIAKRMVETLKATNMDTYGVEYGPQRPDVAEKIKNNRERTMLAKYGAKNSAQIDEIRNKIFASRRKNKTLNTSKAETILGDMLVEYFGEDDVIHNKIIDDRYPYHVDYYIKSLDLFIELNGDRCHNDHWFDPTNSRDIQIANAWLENANRLEAETNKKSRYRNYIKVWTKSDVAKRQCAKENNLNYLVFWDGSCNMRKKEQVPNLVDAMQWFADGCPHPSTWHKENTY